MSKRMFLRGALGLSLILATMVLTRLAGADEAADWITGQGRFDPDSKAVDLFEAIDDGLVEAKLIPRDSKRCRLFVRNCSKQPLNVALPEAFAGVPVLAQNMPFFPGDFEDLGQQNQPQQIGGGLPGVNLIGPQQQQQGQQWLNPGGQQNRAWFNIPPERVAMIKGVTVCLEHGKPDPRPRHAYAIRPIDQVSEEPAIAQLCAMLGRGDVDQRAAQVAAWHLNNGMSFEELARLWHRTLAGKRPMFTRAELERGREVVEEAIELAEKQAGSAAQHYAARGSR